MDEIPIYAVYAVEMILRQNGSWRAARMPFTVTFPPKRREFLVTAGYPASEIKLRNPMIVGLAAVCFDFGHRKTLITLWKPNAAAQARQIAGARDERTLFAVACSRLFGARLGTDSYWASPCPRDCGEAARFGDSNPRCFGGTVPGLATGARLRPR